MSWDLSVSEGDVLSKLGAVSWADCADWCSRAEVYTYFDEAAKRLAELGLFVARETQTISAGTSAYNLPADWLDSIHVSVNGQQCRPASTAELQALDSVWQQTACEPGALPGRYSMDAGQLGAVTLYPQPSGTGELETIDHVIPPDVSTAQTAVPIPSVLSDYFTYFAVQRLYGKESAMAKPEVVSVAAAQVALLEKVCVAYWGGLE